ncbi:MAG: hypothetical protein KAS66_02845 [Candidatus Omnitrophica bacterium]|nr:hypothetical protein [Candidatus Omnitrophota bacterium]
MPYDDQFEGQLNEELNHLTEKQAGVLAVGLSASFVVGWKQESGGTITPKQKKTIEKLAATTTGYMAEFNSAIGKQVIDRILELQAEGVLNKNIAKEIRPFISDVFGPDGKVVIDNVGKKRSIIKVGKDGRLRKVENTITRKYTTNPQAYADMLARTTTHNALENGRAEARQAKGIKRWRFSGPADERSRPWHVAVVGNIYEYGTDQSDYARELLSEPNCRHRSIDYFDDPNLDTPESHYEDLKNDAGLKFEEGEWALPEVEL